MLFMKVERILHLHQWNW